jgi:dipeptidyl aminopeptidase/acylaminoacyl peptidase
MSIAVICLMPVESYAAGYSWVKQVDFVPKEVNAREVEMTLSDICGISKDGQYVLFTTFYLMKDSVKKYFYSQMYLKNMKKGRVILISKNRTGEKANNHAELPGKQAISDSGRYAVFQSEASNLVKSDTNKKCDIFLYDRNTDHLKRISVGSKGRQANGHSCAPAISGNGRYIYYTSFASNLVRGGKENSPGFYRYDIRKGKTTHLPIDKSYMLEGPLSTGYIYRVGKLGRDVNGIEDVSRDGRYITFSQRVETLREDDGITLDGGITLYEYEAYRYDVVSGTLLRCSNPISGGTLDTVDYELADYALICNGTSISGDGRFVVFVSTATNLVDNSVRGGSAAVFLYDCNRGTTRMISKISKRDYKAGSHYFSSGFASISPNGRYVAYILWGEPGPNKVYLYDRVKSTRKLVKSFIFREIAKDGNGGWEEVEPYPGMLVTSDNARYIGVSSMYNRYIEAHSYIVKRK